MHSLGAFRRTGVALLIGAFVVSACGGTASPPPTSGGAASPAATVAATPAPATAAPATAAPATDAPATGGAAGDPADDLEIGSPYTLEPLDEQVAAIFVASMEQSLGSMASVFDLGFRSAIENGETAAWVIVVSFPALPMSKEQMLDQVSQGAAASGGMDVEETTIGGEPARVISAEGQALVVTVLGNEIVMVVGFRSQKSTVDVATALVEAN